MALSAHSKGKDDSAYEIARITKAYVDAQSLGGWQEQLERYGAIEGQRMTTDAQTADQQSLDLEQGPPGFRLFHVEIYNWGTLDQKIWSIPAAGRNVLLTGDIGSGKSTVVDALTTLTRTPAPAESYNRAAGSGPRERTERSYILGYWNKEQTAEGGEKAVALRDTSCYSVLLSVFGNERTDKEITLAQAFWISDVGEVKHFYCTAEGRLGIKDDFSVEEGG